MHPKFSLLVLVVFCTACGPTPPPTSAPNPAASESSSSFPVAESAASMQPAVIEPYLQDPTVEAFRAMTLSGTNLQIGKIIERTDSWTKYYITYTSNGLTISGTLSLPVAEGAHPLIVQNHGYIDPDIYTNGRGLKREQAALARAGFAVLHTDYRHHAQSDANPDPRGLYDAGIGYAIDSANAVLAVRERQDPRIDASRVGMLGHSMGGGVTLQLLVAKPTVIDAAVLYAPVHADAWENFARWRQDGDEGAPTLVRLGTKAENPSAWSALSTLGSLSEVRSPVLLFHGTNDKDVPVAWSQDLAAESVRVGKPIEYVEYEGEGHEFGPKWNDFMTRTITHFKTHLQP